MRGLSKDGFPRYATRDYWVRTIRGLHDEIYRLLNENGALKERLAQVEYKIIDDGK